MKDKYTAMTHRHLMSLSLSFFIVITAYLLAQVG